MPEIEHLVNLGILKTTESNIRTYNVGSSDYSKHIIQPWSVWLEYNLNPWDADIVKRVLRTKEGESRRLDYEKIIHICNERIRQIDAEDDRVEDNETSVFCPSESCKPAYSAAGHIFRVYSVFEWDKHYFAYVGYNDKYKNHMYLSLTKKSSVVYKITDFPLPYVPFNCSLGNTEHSESVKIGALGVDYEKYDYLINDGKLYRYMGVSEDGILFRYTKFRGNFNVDFVDLPYQLVNEAKQVLCRK